MPAIRLISDRDVRSLHLETAAQPMNVCTLLEIDASTMPGGYSFDRLRNGLVLRLRAMPEFRQRLADHRLNLDRPVWVEDVDFDVDRHLHRIGLPAPGSRVELAEVCGHIASLPLDRSRPLWEMWVIENVSGTDAQAGGQVAVLAKVHHSAIDEVSGANLVSQLCTTEPDAPPPDPVAGAGPASDLEIALNGAISFATRPLRLMSAMPSTVSLVVDTIRWARNALSVTAPSRAPKTPFNANVTGRRNVAFARLNLDDVETVKDHFRVKVNDVVLTLVAEALRRHLSDRDELPDRTLIASVPMSVHDHSDPTGDKRVSSATVKLETTVGDPVERLIAIAGANLLVNHRNTAVEATTLQDWAQFAAPAVFGLAMRVLARSDPGGATLTHNLIVSNVPGPRVPLYFLGSRVEAMFQLGPIFHGSGLNVTVTSLQGSLGVGLVSCPDLVPDLWDVADHFSDALDELVAATR